MYTGKIGLALLALATVPVLAAEPAVSQRAADAAIDIEQENSQRIEREMQARIDAELLADIEAKAGITVVYQTARIINRMPPTAADDQRLAKLDSQ